jgi:hypothetical protein
LFVSDASLTVSFGSITAPTYSSPRVRLLGLCVFTCSVAHCCGCSIPVEALPTSVSSEVMLVSADRYRFTRVSALPAPWLHAVTVTKAPLLGRALGGALTEDTHRSGVPEEVAALTIESRKSSAGPELPPQPTSTPPATSRDPIHPCRRAAFIDFLPARSVSKDCLDRNAALIR